MASNNTVRPDQLAARWFQAREHDPRAVEIRYEQLRLAIEQLEISLRGNPEWENQAALQHQLWWVKNHVSPLVDWIAETRAIPAGKAKTVELALRAANTKGKPRDVRGWWVKNKKFFDLIMQAQKWPERGSGENDEQQEVFKAGPFEVHNTLHLKGDKLEKIREVLEKASAAITRSSSKFSRVLYGPVFVVGRITQSKTLAWYNIRHDDIYLRAHTKIGRGELHNIIHELGHRYWFKFMTSAQHLVWKRQFAIIANKAPSVNLPEVGALFPVPLKSDPSRTVTVLSIGPDPFKSGDLVINLSTGGYVKVDAFRRIMEKVNKQREFPTGYASTSTDEFFAESFAMHVLGTLQPQHEAFFVENMP